MFGSGHNEQNINRDNEDADFFVMETCTLRRMQRNGVGPKGFWGNNKNAFWGTNKNAFWGNYKNAFWGNPKKK